MIATQAINLYQITKHYFQNEDDATLLLQEIENVIDDKSEFEGIHFASKADMQNLLYQIHLIKSENKTNIFILKSDERSRLFNVYFWFIPIAFLFVTLLIII